MTGPYDGPVPVWQHYMLRGPGFGHPFGRQVTKDLLVGFYSVGINEPEKLEKNLSKIPNLLGLFQDNHQALVFKLVEKYGDSAERFFDVIPEDYSNTNRSDGTSSSSSNCSPSARERKQEEIRQREQEVARKREAEIKKQAESRREKMEGNQENTPSSDNVASFDAPDSMFGFSAASTNSVPAADEYDFFADAAAANGDASASASKFTTGGGRDSTKSAQLAREAEELARRESIERSKLEVKQQKKERKAQRKKEELQTNIDNRKKEFQRQESDAATEEAKKKDLKKWVDDTIYQWRLKGKGINGEKKLQILLTNLPQEVRAILPKSFPDPSTSAGLSKCRKQILVRLHPDKLSKIKDFKTRYLAEDVTKIINMVVASEINK